MIMFVIRRIASMLAVLLALTIALFTLQELSAGSAVIVAQRASLIGRAMCTTCRARPSRSRRS